MNLFTLLQYLNTEDRKRVIGLARQLCDILDLPIEDGLKLLMQIGKLMIKNGNHRREPVCKNILQKE